MKKIKKVFTLLLAALCVCTLSVSVFATEAEKQNGTCVLTIYMDGRNVEDFEEDITIILTDTESGHVFTIANKFTTSEYLYNIPIRGTVPQGATYSIEFDYIGMSKGFYQITNKDGSEPSSFVADNANSTLEFVLKETARNETSTGNTKEIEDPDVVFERYLEIAKDLENSDLWVKMYGIVYKADAQYYAKMTGNLEDDWNSFTMMERFLWSVLYVYPKMSLESGNGYFSDLDTFHNNVTRTNYKFLSRISEEQANAYLEIMDWQFDYVVTTGHGKLYNFMESEDLPETTAAPIETIDASESTPTATTDAPAETDGIWDGTVEEAKNNWITIAIGLVLVAALIAVVIIRKQRNIKNS